MIVLNNKVDNDQELLSACSNLIRKPATGDPKHFYYLCIYLCTHFGQIQALNLYTQIIY